MFYLKEGKDRKLQAAASCGEDQTPPMPAFLLARAGTLAVSVPQFLPLQNWITTALLSYNGVR